MVNSWKDFDPDRFVADYMQENADLIGQASKEAVLETVRRIAQQCSGQGRETIRAKLEEALAEIRATAPDEALDRWSEGIADGRDVSHEVEFFWSRDAVPGAAPDPTGPPS
jgi:hypothetical protein